MQADPSETRNLADDPAYAGVVREHEAAIAAFFAGPQKPLFPVRRVQDQATANRASATE